jgi:hypothetical protein
LNWSCTVRQVFNGVEFESNVIELLADLGSGKILIEVYINNRNVGTRYRADLFHVCVLRHLLFDLPGDKLLDFLRVHSGPRNDGNRSFDRSIRVFALRHALIAVHTPDADTNQHDPSDVPLLDKEARDIALALDRLIVDPLMSHVGLIRDHGLS